MSTFPKSDVSLDQIARVRKAWIEAVIDADVSKLATLVTDDVVAIDVNGQCTCGKEEFQQDRLHAFGLFDVERVVSSSEGTLNDKWAIEIVDVASTRSVVGDATPIYTHFKIVVVFHRESDESWKVARTIELLG